MLQMRNVGETLHLLMIIVSLTASVVGIWIAF